MAYDFRTLNYLGSKLRLLDFIEENVRRVTPEGAGVCDLFAGSGCVSYKLSRLFPVVACDIQGYSKIICDALLHDNKTNQSIIASFLGIELVLYSMGIRESDFSKEDYVFNLKLLCGSFVSIGERQ